METEWVAIAVLHHKVEMFTGTKTEVDDWFSDVKRMYRGMADRPRALYRYALMPGTISLQIAGLWDVVGMETLSKGGSVWRPRHPKETWEDGD